MTNVAKEVHRFLDHDNAVRKDLGRGLINVRALAAFIQRQLGLNSGLDAIISAIRRYEISDKEDKVFSRAIQIVRHAKLSTKNHVSIISLVKDSSVQQLLPRLFSIIDYARGEVLRIIQAEELLKVVVDQKNVSAVIALFPKDKVKGIERDLAEINMRLDPVSSKVPGVLAILDTELANNNVNIVETMSCVPELLWFIDEKDLLKAHQTFLELISAG